MRGHLLKPEAWLERFAQPATRVDLTRVFRGALEREQVGVNRSDPFHILFVVEFGSLTVNLESGALRLQPGHALWIPPGMHRTIESGQRSIDYRIHFRVEADGEPLLFARTPQVRYEAWNLPPVAKLLREARYRGGAHARVRWRGLLLALAAAWLELPSRATGRGPAFGPRERERLMELAEREGGAAPRIAEMAASVGLSEDYFSRKFRAVFGQPPREFVKRERMRLLAEQLRDSGVSLKELCHRYGLDKSQAVRQFRQLYGCTPTQFRRRR
ncbi:MAG: AraC family transcriptional regulator [Planctomycetota bacterium]|nr:AraC family transcriptional regulator [Planctomycetota bacterium]